MKPFSIIFFIGVFLSGCSKDKAVNTNKKLLYSVSFQPVTNVAADSWAQVLGGKGILTFKPKTSDSLTVSGSTDTLDLKGITSFNKQIVAGKYDIGLQATSIAVADTFIRFNALVKDFVVNKDQTISLAATTTDGVITIRKSIIKASMVPAFTPSGTTNTFSFGLNGNYYFIYVKASVTGKITFTEATTGDIFMKYITVNAMNQYDISATLPTGGFVVNKRLLHF